MTSSVSRGGGAQKVRNRHRKPIAIKSPPWRKAIDRTVAYSPKHVGLATGMVGDLASPNKLVASGLLVIGWAWDNTATWIDRRMKKNGEDNAD
jgi:hypothetical protein